MENFLCSKIYIYRKADKTMKYSLIRLKLNSQLYEFNLKLSEWFNLAFSTKHIHYMSIYIYFSWCLKSTLTMSSPYWSYIIMQNVNYTSWKLMKYSELCSRVICMITLSLFSQSSSIINITSLPLRGKLHFIHALLRTKNNKKRGMLADRWFWMRISNLINFSGGKEFILSSQGVFLKVGYLEFTSNRIELDFSLILDIVESHSILNILLFLCKTWCHLKVRLKWNNGRIGLLGFPYPPFWCEYVNSELLETKKLFTFSKESIEFFMKN